MDSLTSEGQTNRMSYALKRFGEKIRQLRTRMGWSQEELAHKSQLDRSYIGGVERGERNISLLNIHKIAKALNVLPSKLLDGDLWRRGDLK